MFMCCSNRVAWATNLRPPASSPGTASTSIMVRTPPFSSRRTYATVSEGSVRTQGFPGTEAS